MRMCGIYLIYIRAYTRSKVKTESGKVESDSVILVLSVYNPQGATFFRLPATFCYKLVYVW